MKPILVIGESCKDVFQYGTVPRISPEAPCPVFVPTYKVINDGMAANVYNNILAFDKDLNVELITNELKPVKTRFVEEKSNQMLLRVDEFDEVKPCDIYKIDLSKYGSAIISDYNKGYLSKDMIEHIGNSIPLTFLDTKKKMGIWDQNITFRKINQTEYEQTKDSCNERNLIVTLGENGCRYNEIIYPVEEKVIGGDISGAGDTFLAALSYFYLLLGSIEEAIPYANKAASIVVQHIGTYVLTEADVAKILQD